MPAEVLDDDAGFEERPELLTVEVLVPESAVEAPDEGPVEKPLEVARNLQHWSA